MKKINLFCFFLFFTLVFYSLSKSSNYERYNYTHTHSNKGLQAILMCCFIGFSQFSFSQTANTLPPTGNVGVGTTTPNSKLDVVGNTNLGGKVTIDSTVVIKDSVTIQKKLTVDQDIKVLGTSVFVGDGTFKSDLKVLGVAKMKDNLIIDGLTKMNGDANVFGNFKIKSLEDSALTINRLVSINPNGKLMISNLKLAVDDMYICSAANIAPWVGADGTTTDDDILLCPNYKSVTIGGALTVSGNTRLNTTGIGIAPNNQSQLNIRSVGNESGIQLFTIPSTSTSTQKYAFKNIVSNDNINAFAVSKGTISSSQDVFVVKGDGRVGIGTDAVNDFFNAASGEKFMLTVEGAIRTREINVDATSIVWSDYILAKDYPLSSLQEVENYINKHQHLPNVPSEKEVKEKGINLGAMDAILLRKIEELTLYVIEQQKKIEELQNQLKGN